MDGDGPRALAKDARHALEIGAVTLGHVFGDGPRRVGTSACTSSSLTPSTRSPRLTMHAMDSASRLNAARASARRAGAARKYFTRPGSSGLVVVLVRVLRVREEADGEKGLGAHHPRARRSRGLDARTRGGAPRAPEPPDAPTSHDAKRRAREARRGREARRPPATRDANIPPRGCARRVCGRSDESVTLGGVRGRLSASGARDEERNPRQIIRRNSSCFEMARLASSEKATTPGVRAHSSLPTSCARS